MRIEKLINFLKNSFKDGIQMFDTPSLANDYRIAIYCEDEITVLYQCDNQMSLSDYGVSEKETPILKTTGCERTGCMFCGYGCHLEKSPGRFERMKQTHPKIYDYIMRSKPEGGLGYKEIIEWINTNGNMNIKF